MTICSPAYYVGITLLARPATDGCLAATANALGPEHHVKLGAKWGAIIGRHRAT